ncbi:MAG TPA: response regulator [bacterium]|nr:response regulator [bacterium]HQG46057.1 response regulator [bacterium]HQI48007.1 response regulator [bacterium]HQJ64977.1 response regulator [bacterium]
MKKGTVLMVDDNLDMLLIGQRIFTKAGFEYLSARSGQEGLNKMSGEEVDLVILDYMLPDLTGQQFLQALGGEPACATLRSIPVIVLTARTDYLEELDPYYAANLRAILTKPFGHRELVNVVDNTLRLEKSLKSLRQSAAATPAAAAVEAPLPAAAAPAPRWADDLRIAANTIARLVAELRQELPAGLSEQQHLDLDAVLTSSRRLVRLIEEHFPASELFTETTLTT